MYSGRPPAPSMAFPAAVHRNRLRATSGNGWPSRADWACWPIGFCTDASAAPRRLPLLLVVCSGEKHHDLRARLGTGLPAATTSVDAVRVAANSPDISPGY